ncbi:MAG: hypothetical protein NVSMB62_00700 [Acidobacteriaceae bacterium]
MFKRKNVLLAIMLCFGLSASSAARAQAKAPTATTKAAPASATKSASTPAAKPSAATPQKAAAGKELDINTATMDQLKALPGIGDAYAKRIMDGRPYTAKTQLTQKGILPQGTYDKIKDQIIARRGK